MVVALLLVALLAMTAMITLVACNKEPETPTLLVWAPSNAQTFYKTWANKWAETYKDSEGRSYKVKLGIQGEDSAATELQNLGIKDGADVFCFADDQLAQLIKINAISAIGDPTKQDTLAYEIATRNAAGSVTAATADGKLYAYPMQADNGWYLYYNSAFFTEDDVTNWDKMWAKVDAWNAAHPDDQKQMHFDAYGDAWYGASWFYTFGGKLDMTSTTFHNEEVGMKALKAAYHFSEGHGDALLCCNPNDIKAADVNDGKLVALVAGGWVYDNYDCDDLVLTKMPAITDPDDSTKEYTMVSFLGSKLMGVNAQRSYQVASHALANYLTSKEVQIAKAEALKAGPSNIEAADSDAAKSLPTVQALAKQAAYSVPQVNIPDTIWKALPNAALNYVNATNTHVDTYFPNGQADEAKLKELLDAIYNALFVNPL